MMMHGVFTLLMALDSSTDRVRWNSCTFKGSPLPSLPSSRVNSRSWSSLCLTYKSVALHHAVHNLRQQFRRVAIGMLAVPVGRFANQHIRFRGWRGRILQDRLVVATDVAGENHNGFLAALSDRQLQAR